MKELIVAYDQKRGIGADGDLLWQRDLPGDLAHFKQMTMGSSLVMGRTTYESIGRPLPGREMIVVTHRPLDDEGIIAVHSLAEAYTRASRERTVVIGGGQIYEQALREGSIERIHATEVAATFPGATVFFPVLDAMWHETTREHHGLNEHDRYSYDFVTYERR